MRAKTQKNKNQEWTSCLDTPIGPLLLSFTAKRLAAQEYAKKECETKTESPPPPALRPMVEAAKQALSDYFDNGVRDFGDLPLDLQGTPFQVKVWQELQRIPYGTTISYKELARRAGSPLACRAAGQANGRNPVPIIVPCHRVIAADGSLGGYSSGLDRKRWLLEHEGAM